MVPANWEFEEPFWHTGCLVAGIDEAGRGPLAGPVVAAAAVFPCGCEIPWLDDSKQLTAKKREQYAAQIAQCALSTAFAVVGPEVIDNDGLLPATFRAMAEALAALTVRPEIALIDGPLLPKRFPLTARPVVHGDEKCASIAAASIIAKVARDRIMAEYHEQFPQYGFAHNKGYCTEFHLQALAEHGPCPIHRRSFAPLRCLELPFGD